jgi:FtsP/CotA-like multicopper oxidase with cupredoxin domain
MVRIGLMASRFSPIDRRDFLALTGVAVLGAGLGPANAAGAGVPLSLRTKTTSLTLRPGQAATPVWLLEAPSQPLRFQRGSALEVSLQNDLSSPILLNWRGLDGVASAEPLTGQSPLQSGARTSLSVPLRQAGTLFGDIRLLADGASPSLALPLIVEESQAQPVDQDRIVLIEDFRVRADGTAANAGTDPRDASPLYTVNGQISPDIAVHSNERLRLRFINGCQRHVVAAKIEGLEFRVMAIDGLPAEPFFARNGAVVIAPGGRTDVFIDVTLPPGATPPLLLHDGKEAHAIARLVVANG